MGRLVCFVIALGFIPTQRANVLRVAPCPASGFAEAPLPVAACSGSEPATLPVRAGGVVTVAHGSIVTLSLGLPGRNWQATGRPSI